MRHRVALATMALGCVMAGNALAYDVTPVIYDLSTLQEMQPADPAPQAEHGLAMPTLPVSTPSQEPGSTLGETLYSDGALELRGPNRNPRILPGAGAPRGGNENDPNPTPNPEPGTMLLLGTALASGARYVRRRRSA
jgi:hypothetical protein